MRQWWVIPGQDGGELELRTVDRPTPGPGEVVVDVTGAGVNRGELIGRPALRADNPKARPIPSGIEFAGTIAAIGSGVGGWEVGQRVMGRGRACHADATVVPAAALMATPAALSDAEAAAIPNVFVTAHDALITAASAGPEDAVLVTAGSSGVGTAAIQIAGAVGAGAVLATTRSMDKAAAMTDLGATAVIDTGSASWVDDTLAASGPVDVVIDQVGGGLFPGLLRVLAVGGRYVSVGRNDGPSATIDLDLVARNRLHLIGVTFRTRSEEEALACSQRFVDDLLPSFSDGRLRPVLDRTFPLDELPAAHHYMAGNTQVGKIVLVP